MNEQIDLKKNAISDSKKIVGGLLELLLSPFSRCLSISNISPPLFIKKVHKF